MGLNYNTLESYTVGVALPANTATSPESAFSVVSSGVTVDSTHAAHGSKAIKFDMTGSSVQSVNVTGLNTATIAMRGYFYPTTAPTGSGAPQIIWMGTSAQSRIISLIWNNTGTISISVSGVGTVYTSTATVPLNAFTRFGLWIKINGASGEVHFAGYVADGTTPITGMSYDNTTTNLGTTNVGEIRWGRTVSNVYPNALWVDDPAWNDAATALIGPYTSATPTTLVDTVSASVCVVDARNTVTEVGGALTFTWTQTSGPAQTPTQLANGLWFIVPDTTTDLVYKLAVSEAGGHSDSGVVTIPHQPAGNPAGTAKILVFDGTNFV